MNWIWLNRDKQLELIDEGGNKWHVVILSSFFVTSQERGFKMNHFVHFVFLAKWKKWFILSTLLSRKRQNEQNEQKDSFCYLFMARIDKVNKMNKIIHFLDYIQKTKWFISHHFVSHVVNRWKIGDCNWITIDRQWLPIKSNDWTAIAYPALPASVGVSLANTSRAHSPKWTLAGDLERDSSE